MITQNQKRVAAESKRGHIKSNSENGGGNKQQPSTYPLEDRPRLRVVNNHCPALALGQ